MYVYLLNLNDYDATMRLDVSTSDIRVFSRSSDRACLAGQVFGGWYQTIETRFVGFYRYPVSQAWHLLIGDTDYMLQEGMVLESNYSDAWSDEFVIRIGDETVLSIFYPRPEIDDIERLMLDMGDISYEDMDIFVLAADIWNDAERRAGAMTHSWLIEPLS
jgi:hypothetical protein